MKKLFILSMFLIATTQLSADINLLDGYQAFKNDKLLLSEIDNWIAAYVDELYEVDPETNNSFYWSGPTSYVYTVKYQDCSKRYKITFRFGVASENLKKLQQEPKKALIEKAQKAALELYQQGSIAEEKKVGENLTVYFVFEGIENQ